MAADSNVEFVYRFGSGTDDAFTPRPKDLIGESGVLPGLSVESNAKQSDGVNWDEVDSSVQNMLSALDISVARICPSTQGSGGHTSANAWALHSYRVYRSTEHPHVNPVVVGIIFKSLDDGIVICGDISGEAPGDILFEILEKKAVENSNVLDEAREIARRLAKESAVIAAAIVDERRQAE